MSQFKSIVNAPEFPPHVKHQTIFAAYNALQPGEAMLLVNDHDPLPLRFQFEAMHTGQFTWEYIEQGPINFQVKIGKV